MKRQYTGKDSVNNIYLLEWNITFYNIIWMWILKRSRGYKEAFHKRGNPKDWKQYSGFI